MRRLLVVVGLVACADQAGVPADDNDAEMAGSQSTSSGSWLTGLYASGMTASGRQDGDLVAIELTAASAYVRARCYHDGCSVVVPETDHFDHYVSASGLEYLRFWSFDVTHVDGGLKSTPEVADVYEIKTSPGGISLRKSHTTRWLAMALSTPDAACTAGEGKWDGTTCRCPSGKIFVPGAGGCTVTPVANESKCDTTDGLWSDDDATLIGSYCNCGTGRRLDRDGGCASI